MKNKILLLLILTLFSIHAQAQDTFYVNQELDTVKKKKDYIYFEVLERSKIDPNFALVTRYLKNGVKRSEIFYANIKEHKKSGVSNYWFENGQLKEENTYDKELDIELRKCWYESGKLKSEYSKSLTTGKELEKIWYESGQLKCEIEFSITGLKQGMSIDEVDKLIKEMTIKSYWPDGTIKRDDYIKNGDLISGKCFNQKGELVDYFEYNIPASFKGGKEGLRTFYNKEFRTPYALRGKEVYGKVYISFIVKEDGTLSDFMIKKGIDYDADKAVLQFVQKMPAWNPALIDGEPTESHVTFPFKFN